MLESLENGISCKEGRQGGWVLAVGADVGNYGACETHAGNNRSHSAKVWSQTPPTSAFQCWHRQMEERMENGEIKKRKIGTDGKYNENCKTDTERQKDTTVKWTQMTLN